MANKALIPNGPLTQGKTILVIDATPSSAGSITEFFSTDADSLLFSVWADSVSGTLDVTISTVATDGKELVVATFPQLTSSTATLIMKKAAAILSRIKVVATYSAPCQFELRARGISAGETSVKLLGATTATASQITQGIPAGILIPATLDDRSGLIIKNNSVSSIVYIGFTLAECSSSTGYPLGPGESLAIDLSAGQAVYASATAPADLRIMEAKA